MAATGIPPVAALFRGALDFLRRVLDFLFHRDERGRSLERLSVMDESARECPVLLASLSVTATDAIDELIPFLRKRDEPARQRS